jgi:hypothetical protein
LPLLHYQHAICCMLCSAAPSRVGSAAEKSRASNIPCEIAGIEHKTDQIIVAGAQFSADW